MYTSRTPKSYLSSTKSVPLRGVYVAVLVIGGTRNLGSLLVQDLHRSGKEVVVLNRGITLDRLPQTIERLRADRADPAALAAAIRGRTWDAVVDMACYTGAEAAQAVEAFDGSVGRYLFISSGQVYLVRAGEGSSPSAREEDYAGPTILEPPLGTRDHANWLYGIGKRAAEDAFQVGWRERQFPITALRLPMVHSPLDHYDRLHNYLLRLRDGWPLLLPREPDLIVRHVYARDVVIAVADLLNHDPTRGMGEAINLAQDGEYTLQSTLEMLAHLVGVTLSIVRMPRSILEREELLPSCSPFSDRWMSALENTRAKNLLGFVPTPMAQYFETLAVHYLKNDLPSPPGYALRAREKELLASQVETSS